MTSADRFEATIAEWLDAESAFHLPAHLGEVVAQTAVTRQRPAWSSLERWLPVQTAVRFAPQQRLGWLLLIVLALIAVVGVALLAGAQHTRPAPPFGPAANGAVAYAQDGDIYRYDLPTGQLVPLIAGPTYDFGATFSRDGSQLLFARIPAGPVGDGDPPLSIMVADLDGSNVRDLTGPVNGSCWWDWSPDGRRIVYSTKRPSGYGLLNVVDVATGTSTALDVGSSVGCSGIAWRPPNGREIVFRGDDGVRHAVFAIRPDGTGLRQVNTQVPICDCDSGAAMSPDGTTMTVTRWGDEGARIWLLDLNTGTERVLPIPPGTSARGGTFSPDGGLLVYPLLHRLSSVQNAYQVVVAPLDGHAAAVPLGPTITLPDNGSDEAGVGLAFTPDGTSVLASYPDSPTSMSSTTWLLPVDGSPGMRVGRGQFTSIDVQRRAP
jgi:Tol biopolymer transport system component